MMSKNGQPRPHPNRPRQERAQPKGEHRIMSLSNRYWTIAIAAAVLIASALPTIASARPAAAEPSIVDIAGSVNAETGEFSTLIAALDAADLVETLDSRGQYTVFAPTDAAFEAIGLDAESVVLLPTDVLTNILLYHVAPGRRDSGSVLGSNQIIMLNGQFTFPTVDGVDAFINDAQLIAPDLIDIKATNGIIHVIDAVLIPDA
jgi:uncharacterized surface protein with fasciclin (FAS1) repeats